MPTKAFSLFSLSSSDRRLLALLMDRGPLSRAELADTIGVSRPAVTQMIASLERFGLIEERESRKGARGQPARPVGLRASAAFSAGVSFSHTYLDVAIIDLMGTPMATHRSPLAEPTPEAVADAAEAALQAVQADTGVDAAALIGIGIALPGDFRIDAPLLIAHRYFPQFDGLDAEAFFQRRFGPRVFVENDGRTCVIGERLAGAGRHSGNFMVVHLGHGVGGGLFLDHRLYRGAHRNAGPMGTFFPMDGPRPSGQDLLETLRGEGVEVRDFDALDAITPAMQVVIERWCERAGRQLAPALHHVSNVLDPEFFVIGGRLPTGLLRRIVAATGLPDRPSSERVAGAPPVVHASALGSRAGAIGAASMPVLDLLLP